MTSVDLLVVGELNPDLVLRGGDVTPAFGQAERLVAAGDLVLGASGAIMACAAARLGLAVELAAVIGDDPFGRFALDELRAAGVGSTHVTIRAGERTGVGVHLVRDDGDRATLTYSGLIGALRASDVPAAALTGVRHVHVASPFLQTALRPGLAELLATARSAGATTSLDPNWDPSGAWDLDDVLEHLDLLLPNAEEGRRLSGRQRPEQAAASLAARGPRVAMKLGADGALLHDGAQLWRVPAASVDGVVDAVGAGDSFDAGYLVAWLEGCRTAGALRLGCAAASLSMRAAGGTAAQPSREEAERLAETLREPVAAVVTGQCAASATATEIASQPAVWRTALGLPAAEYAKLPAPGAKVLALGCGTSYYVLDAYARRRQELDGGVTRAAIASELDDPERYDAVLLLSRSGTTSDLLGAHARYAGRVPTIAIVGDADSPLSRAVDAAVTLTFADERSVVQTRFASTALALLRRSLGEDLDAAVADAEAVLAGDQVVEPGMFGHIVFLGTGWTLGIAHEAALKCAEAAQLFTEAFAVGEYQHGPVALAGRDTLVWSFAPLPLALRRLVEDAGATVREPSWDPLAELVAVHRMALGTAQARGLDPDRPRHLSRSVVLEG